MLSKKVKYAIKALILLGKNSDVELNASKIADTERIPKKSLDVILIELKNAGYLQSRKGTNGGYSLRIPAEQITMDKIVRLIDGPIARVYCASIFHYHKCDECHDEATCSIKRLYAAVRDQEVKMLANTSLADMIQKEIHLKQLIIS